MVLSQTTANAADEKFANLLNFAGKIKGKEIKNALEGISPDTASAVKWIYANSPLSDWANYPFDLFKKCAEHSLFLLEHSPFLKDIPEDIFLNYVLHPRVNEEELCNCREFFYELLASRIKDLSPYDAIIEANYWNGENMKYQATDRRTVSAITAYRSTYGRCGEESSFGVNVFRSIGIPARQIYTPRWAHCDDNHAWVEVYCGGNWHFLGACEPEEMLNRGWFTNASSRAMLIHSRCFGECRNDEIISKVGMASFLNNLKLYAATKKITVVVKDEMGLPVQNAEVSFGILNYSSIFPAALVNTDENGLASLTCGLGSLNIHVKKGNIHVERMVFAPDWDSVHITLKNEEIPYGIWEDFTCIAPKDKAVNAAKPTEEQKQLCQNKTAAANDKRENRLLAMFNVSKAKALVKTYGYCEEIYEILRESCDNFNSLSAFLEDDRYETCEKEAILLTLNKKDWRDIDTDILYECLDFSKNYEKNSLFYPYIACPRVYFEPLSLNREFIFGYFSDEQKALFKENPADIWVFIKENIAFDYSVEYGQIVTQPVGALTVKNASVLSQKILFVCICRTLGIPARINPMDEQAQYYFQGGFLPVEALKAADAAIIFEKEEDEIWQYRGDFSLAILIDGEYQTLDLSKEQWENNLLNIAVNSGEYRIITSNRLPNGNNHAAKYHLYLKEGESQSVKLHKHSAVLSQMLDNYALEDFRVCDEKGKTVTARAITANRKTVLMWLEEGKEPTEHILNEMLERQEDFKNYSLVFMVRNKEALENGKIRKVLETFKQIEVYFDSFVPNVEILGRRMYVDHEKLPLIIVTSHELNAVYACSGYNVGSGNMIVRILESLN